MWLIIGLSRKSTKIRTTPVLVSYPENRYSIRQNGGYVFSVIGHVSLSCAGVSFVTAKIPEAHGQTTPGEKKPKPSLCTHDVPANHLLFLCRRIEFERVYRREEAYLRFAGSPSAFLDVRGDFVWSPPGFGRRFYRLEYRKDDTGFYVNVIHGQKCVFTENPVSIKCSNPGGRCYCLPGEEEFCMYLRTLAPGLSASLVGG